MLNQIRFSDESGKFTIETASSRSSKSKSLLLTPFSSQEYELAVSITELMEFITAYPNIPENVNDDRNQKPSQMIIRKAASVASNVKKLSGACGDALRSLSRLQVEYNQTDVKAMKAKLYNSTIATVDILKQNLVNGKLDNNSIKKKLIEHLIDIANQSDTMITYATKSLRALRRQEIEEVENIDDKGQESNFLPDGEGYSIIIPAGLKDGRPDDETTCDFCLRTINFKEKLIQYLGSNYHQKCFICFSCSMPLTHSCFLTQQGNPICRSCSPRCGSCRKPITSDCFLALEKAFHLSCFKCSECSTLIGPEDKFYRKSNGVSCAECITKVIDTVFQEKWNPSMKTRFSMYLQEEDAEMDVEVNKRQVDKSVHHTSKGLQSDLKNAKSDRHITLTALKSLPSVLSSDEGIDSLIKFCVQEFCIEKLFFWMDVEQFRFHGDANPSSIQIYANSILEKYLKNNGDLQLDFPIKLTNQVQAIIFNSKCTINMFDQMQEMVYEELENLILPKFLKSSIGVTYLQRCLGKNAQITSTRDKVEQSAPKSDLNSNNCKDPDHILTLDITNFEKRYKPEKHTVFEVAIKRTKDVYSKENSKTCPLVYRKYEDFVELGIALQRFFPDLKEKIPQLLAKPLGFFNIAGLKNSKQKQKELNEFVHSLLKLPTQVVQSIIVKKFLQPTQEDLDNYEFTKNIISSKGSSK